MRRCTRFIAQRMLHSHGGLVEQLVEIGNFPLGIPLGMPKDNLSTSDTPYILQVMSSPQHIGDLIFP